MDTHRATKSTCTPVILDPKDRLLFKKSDGSTTVIELVSTRAYILERNYPHTGHWVKGDISVYGFAAVFLIDGEELEITREVGSQKSFYEPVQAGGLNLWLDAVKGIFDTSYDHHTDAGGFLVEKDFLGGHVCMPRKEARLVVQEIGWSICPMPMTAWFGDAPSYPDIKECYNGEDCWMGPYAGAFAHCGLDINMPAGTILTTPIDLDTQYYFKHLDTGIRSNGWCGLKTWEGNSIWRISTSHTIDALVEEHIPLSQGTEYATAAGTGVGSHEHTHFGFQITEQRGTYTLDPWILFWQMLQDTKN